MKKPLIALLGWFCLAPLVLAGELAVHFIDVGQGDSALVVGPDGTTVLIDGGSAGDGSGMVVPYLNSIGVTGLAYSIMTHWHTDHYGGMDEVFNAGFLPSVSALDRGNTAMPSGTQVTQYLSAVGTKRNTAFLGQTLQLGDGATLEIVAINVVTPLGSVSFSGAAQVENGRSIAVVVRYKDFDLYIGGDITSGGNGTANVEGLVATYVGEVEVAKASHHGSSTSSSSTVVNAFDPAIVIYSCGLDNSYGHPSASVVDQWSDANKVRMQWGTTEGDTGNGSRGWTSADSSIQIKSNGYRYSARPAGTSDLVELTTFENTVVALGPGDGAITELLVDPQASSDTYGEWVELANLQYGMNSLAGAGLKSGAKEVVLRSPILLEHHKRIVMGADGHRSRNGNVFVPICWPENALNLVNSASSVSFESPVSAFPIHTVSWSGGGDISVTPGVAYESQELGIGALYQPSVATFGAGDKGTPGYKNTADTNVYPTWLVVAQAFFDDAIEFRLEAPAHPFQFYALAVSPTANVGFDVLGVQFPLDNTPLLLSTALLPGSIGALNFDRKTVKWTLPGSPWMIGQSAYAAFLTFDAALNGTSTSPAIPFTIQ